MANFSEVLELAFLGARVNNWFGKYRSLWRHQKSGMQIATKKYYKAVPAYTSDYIKYHKIPTDLLKLSLFPHKRHKRQKITWRKVYASKIIKTYDL
jgi:hypothetical protein